MKLEMESDTILSILSEMEEEEGAGSYLLQIPIQNFQITLHPSSNIWPLNIYQKKNHPTQNI